MGSIFIFITDLAGIAYASYANIDNSVQVFGQK